MNNQDQLQAEQSILIEMALMSGAIGQHKEDERYEYGCQDRQDRQEAMDEYNSEPHN